MFKKFKKALKVAKDLDTLDFTFDSRRSSLEGLPFSLVHPEKSYSIWTANGFLFISIYEVGHKNVFNNHKVSKFGAIGKIIVWWKCQKHINKWHKECKLDSNNADQLLLNKIMEKTK